MSRRAGAGPRNEHANGHGHGAAQAAEAKEPASSHGSDMEDESDEAAASSASASAIPARFRGQSAYEVLGVSRTATSDELKKAYRRMALRVHPDVNRAPTATAEFQFLSRCHEMLADARRRARYDATGSMDDTAGGAGADGDDMSAAAESGDAYAYWRSIFPKIELADIEAYRQKYEGGNEERQDVLDAWREHKGDLRLLFESVPFASATSVPRIVSLLNEHAHAHISRKAASDFAKRLAAEEGSEAGEAEEALQEILNPKEQQLMRSSRKQGGNGEDALAIILQSRQRDRGSFLASLEARYAGGAGGGAASKGGKKGSKRKGAAAASGEEGEEAADEGGEPSEEAFAAMAARKTQRDGKGKGADGGQGTPKKKCKK